MVLGAAVGRGDDAGVLQQQQLGRLLVILGHELPRRRQLRRKRRVRELLAVELREPGFQPQWILHEHRLQLFVRTGRQPRQLQSLERVRQRRRSLGVVPGEQVLLAVRGLGRRGVAQPRSISTPCLVRNKGIIMATNTTRDADIRAALDQHWAASNAGKEEVEGQIYCDDVELEYPQSGERFRGRRNVVESRGQNPSRRRFEVRRTVGSGDLWVIEYVLFYDERAVPTVSIMEFRGGKVARETQYFADPFEAPAWRARWRDQPPGSR